MAWRGIPFPVSDHFDLVLNKIPQLKVITENGFAWDSLAASALGAMIAAAIPAAIAWWSIKQNTKTLLEERAEQQQNLEKDRISQTEIAEKNRIAQIVSANRLVWIKDLREASAEFISASYENILLGQRFIAEYKINKNSEKFSQAQNDLRHSLVRHILCMSRITMMLNPLREEHIKVIALMNSIKDHCDNTIISYSDIDKNKINSDINELVLIMQALLKEDWEKAKNNM
ncbi:hypothetical protein [Pseudescherichia sp.]|uniref:hypothetical protein n=1 Tax=Pseudescherichia sp. TaxID=2055881 RepID=UPI0028B1221F|nr:hypothetical protein [Pseudescherichia sp.]